MRIERGKLVVADAVLALVELSLQNSRVDKGSLWLEAYSNCREQGYCIVSLSLRDPRYISFSENRNDDSVVVYVGDKVGTGNCPTEETYKSRRYFQQPHLAAEYIFQTLLLYQSE